MIVQACQHEKSHKHGKDRQGRQRFKCAACSQTFVEPSARPLGDMRTSMKQVALALSLLLEGMSVRSVQRLNGSAAKRWPI